ncbi:hypothetical protein ACFE04_024010 [Oxalis oulophora]
MSMIEKLFVQIFEKKKKILEQVKHQTDIFDQHLATKCLLQGIDPPPWLFPLTNQDLNREDLISEFLFPKSQNDYTFSRSRSSFHHNPAVSYDGTKFLGDLSIGVPALCNAFDTGNASSTLLPYSTPEAACVLEGVPELDLSVSSPQENRIPFISDNQSLARLQRSKSRQKALELRSSAKPAKSRFSGKSNIVGRANEFSNSNIKILQPEQADRSGLLKSAEKYVGDSQIREKGGSSYSGKVQIAEEKEGDCHSKANGGSNYVCVTKGKTQPTNNVDEPETNIFIDNDGSYEGRKVIVGTDHSEEKECAISSERITRSNSSTQPLHNVNVYPKLEITSGTGKSDSGRVTRSSSSFQNPSPFIMPSKLGNFSSITKKGGMQTDYVGKTTQEPSKVKTCTNQSKDEGSSKYSGRITRSKRSSQPLPDLNMFPNQASASGIVKKSPKSFGKSAQPAQCPRFSENEEETDLQSAQGHQLSTALLVPSELASDLHNARPDPSCSMQKLSGVANSGNSDYICSRLSPFKNSEHSHMLAEGALPNQNNSDISIDDHLSKENSGDHHVAKRSKIETPCFSGGKRKSATSMISSSGVKRSQCTASVKSPLASTINDFEGVKLNILPRTESIDNFDLDDAVVVDTDTESNELTTACPVNKGLNMHSSSPSVGLDDLFSSELHQYTVVIRPTEVDFDDASMDEPSNSDAKGKEEQLSDKRTITNCNSSYLEYILPGEELLSKVDSPEKGFPDNSSSALGTSEFFTDAVTFTSPERNQMSTEQVLDIDCSTREIITKENSSASPLKNAMGSNLSDIRAARMTELSFGEDVGKKYVSDDDSPGIKACDDHKISEEAGYALLINPNILLRDASAKCPSSASTDEQKVHAGINSDEKELASSISSKSLTVEESILPNPTLNFDVEGSQSQNKRRKDERLLSGVLYSAVSLQEDDIMQDNVDKCPMNTIKCNMEGQIAGETESLSEPLDLEDELRMAPFTFMQEDVQAPLVSSFAQQQIEVSSACLAEEELANPTTMISNLIGLHDIKPGSITEQENIENLYSCGRNKDCEGTDGSSGLLHTQTVLSSGDDQYTPEFDTFIMQDNEHMFIKENGINFENLELPMCAIERANALEQLCKSACMQTPLPNFSSPYKYHETDLLHKSVPNGLLECMNPRGFNPINDDSHVRSHSDCLPLSKTQYGWNIKKPYTSPIRKVWDGMISSSSGSSEKRSSLNPELPCINEENENLDDVVDGFQQDTEKKPMVPLDNTTENSNLPLPSVSEVYMCARRSSLASVNTDFSFASAHSKVRQNLGNPNGNSRRHATNGKENRHISQGGGNRVTRANDSIHNIFSKPKLSGKNSLRLEGSNMSQQSRHKPKRNNIVSNMTSFIPLVQQQKQAPAIMTGKRDVKVKALQAAEAAKRLQEKKENERKKKKEASKFERAKLVQENRKQLELQQKRKEEEQKKKEAEMAARKRQREEEERKEREKKRKRVEEPKKHQPDQEKMRALKDEKDNKCRTNNEMEQQHIDETGNEAWDENIRKVTDSEIAPRSSRSHPIKDRSVVEGYMASISHSIKAMNEEESYVISPYKSSDDEDEDEDDIPNTKYIPSWASKNRLAAVPSSQSILNPEDLFLPKSFPSISEVLLPRRLQGK